MELKEILAISGQPGLDKFVAQSVRGVIVESLLDGRRMNASANAKVSALSEISMFTEGEDIALADVFTRTSESKAMICGDTVTSPNSAGVVYSGPRSGLQAERLIAARTVKRCVFIPYSLVRCTSICGNGKLMPTFGSSL